MLQLRTHRTNAHQPQAISRQHAHHRSSTSRDETASAVRPSTSRDESATRGPSVAKRARSECKEVDPLQPRPWMLPLGDDNLTEAVREVYADHWSSIRTHHRTGQ